MKDKYLIAAAFINADRLRPALRKIKRYFFARTPKVTEKIHEYFLLNQQRYSRKSKEAKILMDIFPNPSWIFVNAVLANEICDREDAEIESFNASKRDSFNNLVYNSFGCRQHHLVELNQQEHAKRKKLYLDAIQRIQSKQDLLNYEVDGVKIGTDIYETILASCKVPTIDLDAIQTHKYLLLGLTYYLFASRLFLTGKYKALLVSHDNYISMGTVAQVAYKYKVPVYLANLNEIIKPAYFHHLYKRFLLYPKIFNQLNEEEKKAARNWSRSQLALRLSGKVGVEMSYQTKSAFERKIIKRQTKDIGKPKILIATHCFYDNPHGLGWMLFPDFYEWICFLGNLSKKVDYDWYIKVHRDYLPGTMKVIKNLRRKFSNLTIINPETSWHQLKKDGVSTVLTCYGSIGHELPLLGFNVINAAYNPHIAYSFNAHPKTIEEYEELIKNIEFVTNKIDIQEIYEFFYVHTKIVQPDNIFFPSNKELLSCIKTSKKDVEYQIYLANREKIDENIQFYFNKLEKRKTSFIYE